MISHGFAARMVFQTGLLAKLTERAQAAAVVVPDKEDENLKSFCAEQGASLYQYKPQVNFFTVDYLFKRKYFLEDIRRNPALWAKHLRAVYGNKSRNPYIRLRPFYYYLVYLLVQRFPALRRRFLRQEDRLLRDEKAEELLKEIDPALVVATYPINLPESVLLRSARRLGTPTVIHLLSWDNISCKGYFPALADYYIAWGAVMKEEFMSYYGIPADRIFACGVPHFDQHRPFREMLNRGFSSAAIAGDYLEALGLDRQKPYLFIALSSPVFCPRGIDVAEWLAAQVQRNVYGEDMQLIVRPHPQNVQSKMADFSWLPRLRALEGKRVAVDYPDLVESELPWSMKAEDMRRLSALLAGASITLNFGSTVTIDALMVGRPVIISAFDGEERLPWWQSARRQMDYAYFQKLLEMGGAKVAYDYTALDSYIKHYLRWPEADRAAREYALRQECGEPDGRATERVANVLLRLAKKHSLVS